MNAYYLIIGVSVILIFSHFFNRVSAKTNIPAVLLLIIAGVAMQPLLELKGFDQGQLFPLLEVLGIVGLIMIVLEAALDLKISREKWPYIWKAGLMAFLSFGLSVLFLSLIFRAFYPGIPTISAVIYAVPLSIMSSAVVIPSVSTLPENKKEFMIYESTISDILGIMVFYFLLEHAGSGQSGAMIASDIGLSILITVALSIVLSYILILAFQRITSDTKLFMLMAMLLLLYSVGKLFHLSSLLIILVFGIMLENKKIFFGGRMQRFVDEDRFSGLIKELKILTRETSFVVRTFFFVVFGLTIVLSTLVNLKVGLIALIFMVATYGVRWLLIRLFVGKDSAPLVFIAPRGLISILLFFNIPEEYLFGGFESGVLLFTILATTIIMSVAMVRNKRVEYKKRKSSSITDIEDNIVTFKREK